MSQDLPLVHSYNLARLRDAGDEVLFSADAQQREEIARWLGLLSVEKLGAKVGINKLGPKRFKLFFHFDADVTQRCVVTLDPVAGHLERDFHRELHFVGPPHIRQAADAPNREWILGSEEEEGPEETESLHYDLASPVLEEFVLSLDPYPRCPGVEFSPPLEGLERPESPFAVLKGSK